MSKDYLTQKTNVPFVCCKLDIAGLMSCKLDIAGFMSCKQMKQTKCKKDNNINDCPWYKHEVKDIEILFKFRIYYYISKRKSYIKTSSL